MTTLPPGRLSPDVLWRHLSELCVLPPPRMDTRGDGLTAGCPRSGLTEVQLRIPEKLNRYSLNVQNLLFMVGLHSVLVNIVFTSNTFDASGWV